MNEEDSLESLEGQNLELDSAIVENEEVRLHSMKLKEHSTKRELRRLRNTVSFRLGLLLTDVFRKPWTLLFLPFTIPFLLFSIGMERLGKWPLPYSEFDMNPSSEKLNRDCIVFFPTNGVGFGHFTRMYALARRFKKKSPDTEIVFFTTMPTLHLLYNEGFYTYHISGRSKTRGMAANEWNAMLEENLAMIFNQHRPKMFIFDGAFPYRGMLNAILGRSDMKMIWMRRGTFRKGSSIPVDSIQHFNMIIRPEDSVDLQSDEIAHNVEVIRCSPILLLDDEELLPRVQARRRLGFPDDVKVVYVQLGAGRINDIDSEVRLTVDAILEHDDVMVALGESMLGERLEFNLERVRIIRDYPNSLYLNAFDASVQAGGYNSYHESRNSGVPTLFYPNMNTGMDDQLARCKASEKEGWGIVIEHRNKDSINKGIEDLLTKEKLNLDIVSNNGAWEICEKLS